MKHRSWNWRLGGGAALCMLALALTLGSSASQAGIRRVLEDWGLVKPSEPQQVRTATAAHTLPWQGYACCNLHYEGDGIGDGNYAELPMIAAGTPIEVLSFGHNKAYVKVDGKPMRLIHDFGTREESLENWVGKIVVDADPRPRIQAYSQTVREAIRQGKLSLGMTREQAIVAVGYPLTNENASPDAPTLRMWRSRRGEYQLNFQTDGHLASVTGEDEVTREMLYHPGR
jgi:hypothetical protein